MLTSALLTELTKPVVPVPSRARWRASILWAVKISVAALLLAALYCAADWREVIRATARLEPWLLAAALVLFVPQTLVSAMRWKAWVQPLCHLSVRQAARQTLAASALNLVVPSKLGDLSKAAMLPPSAVAVGSGLNEHRSRAALLAAVEKAVDLAMLALLCGVGWIAGSGVSVVLFLLSLPAIVAVPVAGLMDPPKAKRWLTLASWTFLLWLLHLAQIGLFLWSAGVQAGASDVLARVPLAIFAGLLPVSFCGLGTRDAALVYLFADMGPASTMAVVGLLTGLRYVIPGAVGIPFVGRAFGRSASVGRQPLRGLVLPYEPQTQ